jgi:hypothetical protein
MELSIDTILFDEELSSSFYHAFKKDKRYKAINKCFYLTIQGVLSCCNGNYEYILFSTNFIITFRQHYHKDKELQILNVIENELSNDTLLFIKSCFGGRILACPINIDLILYDKYKHLIKENTNVIDKMFEHVVQIRKAIEIDKPTNNCLLCFEPTETYYICKPCNHVLKIHANCLLQATRCPICNQATTTREQAYLY